MASYLGLIVFQHRWCTSGRNPWAASADSEILQGHVAGWKFSRRTSVQKAFQGQKQSFFLNRCTLIWTSWATMRWGSWVSDPKLTKLNFSKLQRERQTWNLSKILHRRIFRLKILYRQFHLILTVLVRKNTKNEWKWRNLHRWQKIYTAAGTDCMDKFHIWGETIPLEKIQIRSSTPYTFK